MPPSRETIESTFGQLRRVMGRMHGRMRHALAQEGLTPPQAMIVRMVLDRGRTTPKEMAEGMGVTPGNITSHLNRLEELGYLTRSRSTEDKRVQYVRVTEKAHEHANRMYDLAMGDLTTLFADWREEELQTLHALLARIAPDQGAGC